MKEYYHLPFLSLYHADCMGIMKQYPDYYFDLAIVDPPYGLKRFDNLNGNCSKFATKKLQKWDVKPNDEYFNELFRISKNQIIWGGNNFNLPTSEYFIIWHKSNKLNFTFAMCEQAWTNVRKPAKMFTYMEEAGRKDKTHPTQKPVELYRFLLKNYAKENDKIFDSHLGSGSIAIACDDLGYDLTACEIDEDYFNKANKRLEQHRKQQRLF